MDSESRKACRYASIFMILMTIAYLMLDPAFSPYSYFGGACTVGALVFLAIASLPETPNSPESPSPCSSDSPPFSA